MWPMGAFNDPWNMARFFGRFLQWGGTPISHGTLSVCPPVETLHLDERPWHGVVHKCSQAVAENGTIFWGIPFTVRPNYQVGVLSQVSHYKPEKKKKKTLRSWNTWNPKEHGCDFIGPSLINCWITLVNPTIIMTTSITTIIIVMLSNKYI